MKKSIVILASLVLLAGVSFGQDSKAAPAKQTAPAKDVKAADTKGAKATSKDSKGSKAEAAPKKDVKAADKPATK